MESSRNSLAVNTQTPEREREREIDIERPPRVTTRTLQILLTGKLANFLPLSLSFSLPFPLVLFLSLGLRVRPYNDAFKPEGELSLWARAATAAAPALYIPLDYAEAVVSPGALGPLPHTAQMCVIYKPRVSVPGWFFSRGHYDSFSLLYFPRFRVRLE